MSTAIMIIFTIMILLIIDNIHLTNFIFFCKLIL